MARVSLIREEEHPELADLLGRIKVSRRRGNVYRVLLHSPAIALTWFEQNNAFRSETNLDGKLRELAIIRVIQIKNVHYLLQAHLPKIALNEGLSAAQCDVINDWRNSNLFDKRERAVLAFAEAMTESPDVPEATFDALRPHFSERQLVELTVLIGAYIMSCHVLSALAV